MSQDQLEDAKNVAELTEDIANKAGAEKIAEMAGNVSTSFDAIEGVTDALECCKFSSLLFVVYNHYKSMFAGILFGF